MTMYSAQFLASGELPRRNGSGQAGIAPYRAYKTKDGDLVVAAGNNSLFEKFCGVLGRPQWPADARFKDNPDRVRHAEALYAMIEPEMAGRSSAEWTALLDAAGVPCAPVQNVRQMLEHEQLAALGLLQPVPGSSVPLIGLPVSFDGNRPQPRAASPALGQHTKEVLGA
jgi:crotonobetainyl-CoA:carnitine CoA-transferase CaiB-like acyl-CoA transferase